MHFGSEAPTKNLRHRKLRPTSATSNLSCFENQINIDGDMVQYVVTNLRGDSDYEFAESRTCILLEVKLPPKI
jgi:hypothetical protein